jgi:hypothetical protein
LLDDLFSEAAERGLAFNNLFQRKDGLWQCNLRSETHATAFAVAPTAADAVSSALSLTLDFPLIAQGVLSSIEPPAQKLTLADLGIKPAKGLIHRR